MEYKILKPEDCERLRVPFFRLPDLQGIPASNFPLRNYIYDLFKIHLGRCNLSNECATIKDIKSSIYNNFDKIEIYNSRGRALREGEIGKLSTFQDYKIITQNANGVTLNHDGDISCFNLKEQNYTHYFYFHIAQRKGADLFFILREVEKVWGEILSFYREEIVPEKGRWLKRAALARDMICVELEPFNKTLLHHAVSVEIQPYTGGSERKNYDLAVFTIWYDGNSIAKTSVPLTYIENNISSIATDVSNLACLASRYRINDHNASLIIKGGYDGYRKIY